MNSKKRIAVYFFAFFQLIILCWTAPVSCAEYGTPEGIYSFANYLFNTQDYYRAITEYRRLIFHYPDHRLAKISKLKIGYSYKMGRKWDKAIAVFDELRSKYPKLDIGKEAAYQVGGIYYTKGDYKLAISTFKNFVKAYPKDELTDKAQYKTGWSYLHLENYMDSAMTFDAVSKKSKYYNKAKSLAIEVETFPELPHKSPMLAGAMSALLPGAGQAYTERYVDSITAFLLNALFLWGTIESASSGNEVTASILAFFELGWYTGNIYNAVNDAHKYNRTVKKDFINNLKETYDISFSIQHNKDDTRLVFAVLY